MAIEIEELAPEHSASLGEFIDAIGEGDLAIIKEPIADPGVREQWASKQEGRRFVAVEDGVVVGFGAIIPQAGWSAHVGELRLVTHPGHRRKGIGRKFAQGLLQKAIEADFAKVMVEVVAEDEATITLFRGLGFQPEALLADQIRTRDGQMRDLILLAHNVAEVRGLLETVGAADTA